ncbi:PIN domain-containing protein [Nitrosomonas sp. Is35]|uniref:PIN domain-containing protein n=1 Tax=Nitrosomonas sp. Is35 TaxID=3080534 RepID=UPI00294AE0B4|nr:PIN domain-containing protein [Nitrosomonas sp. Is35]MDV6348282.1 PIN domain-containing protein [Nitrosomonas sp. Is35]
MTDKAFLDTNILLYLLSADPIKAGKAEDIIASGSTISVQVLNEFASVASRKLQMPFEEIQEILTQIRTICAVEPITIDTHDRGIQLSMQYRLSIYDAMIVAAALLAGCTTLYSEDMHDGQVIDQQLTIKNPFV